MPLEPAFSHMFCPWLLLQPVIRTLALPLGRALRVSDKQSSKVQTNAKLEGFYILLGRTPKKKELVSLAKQSDLLARKLSPWEKFSLSVAEPVYQPENRAEKLRPGRFSRL
ncbi:hypothetical protein IHE44_0009889 [Lamprotornis superbus]|uniref:BRCT domain-containing protein n=1 Tax=Lamprotornis superbus TaxID=245042 RepID=A0A835NLK6_9PASS|nr:hypothetical protein IHE44_0009889 [Lamprotornis superbus]